jgi:hypothetical protein
MDEHVERLLARVAADDSGDDFNADDWERLYHIAAFASAQNVVPTQEEVKTHLVLFGCPFEKATVLSKQFSHLCMLLESSDHEAGR